jgi:uncharacterized protein (TIGR02453 family)
MAWIEPSAFCQSHHAGILGIQISSSLVQYSPAGSELMINKSPTFPPAGLSFLRSLKRNNNREWFLKHKQTYEESVRAPMIHIIEGLAEEFADFAPEILVSPKCIFRIYRDTRFSKDKQPFKTHVAASFSVRGLDRHEGAGFYFHIAPKELWIGGGIYRPAADQLRSVRNHVAANHERLKKIVEARRFRKLFGALSGEQSSRMPRGFPANHPAEQYLRYKDLLAARELKPADATKAAFFAMLVESFRAMHPLIRFLNEPILRDRSERDKRDRFIDQSVF